MIEKSAVLMLALGVVGLVFVAWRIHRLVHGMLAKDLEKHRAACTAALRAVICYNELPRSLLGQHMRNLETALFLNLDITNEDKVRERRWVIQQVKLTHDPAEYPFDALAVAAGLADAREACSKREQGPLIARLQIAEVVLRSMHERVQYFEALINNPHNESFLDGVRTEAAHQVERWGEIKTRGKSAEAWHWLCAYLAGKALRAAITGDREKAQHHTISTAAALLNWHDCIATNPDATGAAADSDLARHDQP